jgi:hypothetical protein
VHRQPHSGGLKNNQIVHLLNNGNSYGKNKNEINLKFNGG